MPKSVYSRGSIKNIARVVICHTPTYTSEKRVAYRNAFRVVNFDSENQFLCGILWFNKSLDPKSGLTRADKFDSIEKLALYSSIVLP